MVVNDCRLLGFSFRENNEEIIGVIIRIMKDGLQVWFSLMLIVSWNV